MKKILLSLFVLFSFAATYAQNTPKLLTTTTYGNTLDTVVNTAAISSQAINVSSWYYGKSVQVEVILTKISGTVGGTLGLYGSMNGTNWVICETATTPSDASANYFISTTKRYAYYKVMHTGTGTMSASIKSYLLH